MTGNMWCERISCVVLALLVICVACQHVSAVTMYAPINMGGVKGHINFHQENADDNVTITVHLMTAGDTPFTQRFAWSLHELPVFYDSKSPCASSELGRTRQDFSRRHGPLTIGPAPNVTEHVFFDRDIRLHGSDTIWGRSLLLRSFDNANGDNRSCANILDDGDLRTAEATFLTPVAGTVIFRQGDPGETIIFSNLFHTGEEYMPSGRYEWKVLITDILDEDANRRSVKKCEFLQILFDPDNKDDSYCTTRDHTNCKMGDMTKKHGEIVVAPTNSRYSKKVFVDSNLPLSALDGYRSLYLVLYEKANPFRIMSCSKINLIKSKEVKAYFDADGVRGTVSFSQRYRMDPTIVTVNLKGLRGRGGAYHVHEFPVPQQIFPNEELCADHNVGENYNPFEVDRARSPLPARGTNDQYEVGDISGKNGFLADGPLADSHFGIYADFNLPLFGPHSVVGRSIVIHRLDGTRWICSSVGYPGDTTTAVATFYYPVVGWAVFRQDATNPRSDTSVYVELSYSDGSSNNTDGHRLDIHEDPPGRDFYNWTKRCESVGDDYNPFDVGIGRQKDRLCHTLNPLRCPVGDMSGKSERIIIAARKGSARNKFFYTDVNLPLSGPHSIGQRSLVVHDDHAPPHRGDRLACARILPVHPVKAAVRMWSYGAGIPSNVSGSVIFQQDTPLDMSEVHIDLVGLQGLASAYSVHELPVPKEKSFPCNDELVGGHFNPFRVDTGLGPSPGVGSVDQYEVGDLSGKYGALDSKDEERISILDNNIQLYGQHSVVGRSVVVNLRERNQRWACGTILPEITPEEGRELIAIASFDDPDSAIQGYVRLRQLEYKDGSTSDTYIEVDLRYPGRYDRNMTSGHEWAVYVNQVSHDAVEKNEKFRCVAAGYRWNPYLSMSSVDSYKTDCSPANPLRCEMGDLTGKHAPLEVGRGRRIYTDVNLPLVGNYSVLGRSVVIFGKNGSPLKLACSNIKSDIHLVRHVTVRKFPGFTSGGFMNHMRELINASDWLVLSDAQAERDILDGQCTQMTVHFFGPDAHRLQIEFGNLVSLGSIRKNTRLGPQVVKTYYKPCKTLEEELQASRASPQVSTFQIFHVLIALVLAFALQQK